MDNNNNYYITFIIEKGGVKPKPDLFIIIISIELR
jgi:hypothetical protein